MPISEAPRLPRHHKENPRLTHPTLDKLQALKLMGMSHGLLEQRQRPEMPAGPFEERLGLLVDRERTAREDRRRKTRWHQAKLRQTACIEAIDYRHLRGLDKALLRSLATCQWIRDRHTVLITGPTGIGKPCS
jgi:DNA replication protein DnaC